MCLRNHVLIRNHLMKALLTTLLFFTTVCFGIAIVISFLLYEYSYPIYLVVLAFLSAARFRIAIVISFSTIWISISNLSGCSFWVSYSREFAQYPNTHICILDDFSFLFFLPCGYIFTLFNFKTSLKGLNIHRDFHTISEEYATQPYITLMEYIIDW